MLTGDYKLGGGWGCHVSLLDSDAFKDVDLGKDTVKVYGHHPEIPKKGQTVVGEFQNSFIKFEFIRVEREDDPPDMFFADIKAIKQEMKGPK